MRRGGDAVSRRAFIAGSAAFAAAGCRTSGWFGEPDLRFGVISDTHVTVPSTTALMEKAFAWFRKRGADAVMIPGDLTDWGLKSSLGYVADAWKRHFGGTGVVPLFCTGNHEYRGWAYGDMTLDMHAHGYSEDEHLTLLGMGKCWQETFGEEFAPVRVRTVKGYDFISGEWQGYKELPAWMAANGERFRGAKPFFYFQHPPMKGTTSDATGNADSGAGFAALRDFPNAIAFTGHTHRPFTDERSIWQGEFTAIAVPSLSYACFPPGHENAGRDPGATMPELPARRDLRGGQGYFVTVWRDRVVVERIDIEEGCIETAPAWTIPVGTSERPYELARRTAESSAPEFPAGAMVETETRNTHNRSGNWAIAMNCEFPAAVAAKGERVYDYEIKAVPEDGSKPLVKRFLSPAYHYGPHREPKRMRFWFNAAELPQCVGYVLEVRAYNCFGKASQPLRSRVWKSEPGLDEPKSYPEEKS